MHDKHIPKIIHYCWFGGNPIPEKCKEYMMTWRNMCPDYQIVEWNENNFDVNCNSYCSEAYKEKKWAFVSDYARLRILYVHGGIYFDTDVEVIKDISPLIQDGIGFIGFQNSEEATTGLGMAVAPNNICVKAMLDLYEKRHFILPNGKLDLTPCPAVNTVALKKLGLKTGVNHSRCIQLLDGIKVYPQEYFNPLNADTLELRISSNTYTIHRYTASWISDKAKSKQRLKRVIPNWILNLRVIFISRRDIRYIEQLTKI